MQFILITFSCEFACQPSVLKMFLDSGCLCSEFGIVWQWYFQVNLHINSSLIFLATAQSKCPMMTERDNVLNTLSNSRGFACQESAKNVSWPWLSPLQGSDGLTTGCPHGFCKKNSRTFPRQNSKITEQQQNKFSLTLRDQHKSRKFNNYDCYTHILRLTLTMMAVVIKFSLYFQK